MQQPLNQQSPKVPHFVFPTSFFDIGGTGAFRRNGGQLIRTRLLLQQDSK